MLKRDDHELPQPNANDMALSGPAFTVASLARYWSVKPDTVYAMIHAGRLKAFRFGGKLYRIRPEEVARFECQDQATPSSVTETFSPSSGAMRTGATDIRLERLIDHRPEKTKRR